MIAVLVVGVLVLRSHRQKTPVTHRDEHVGLTDAAADAARERGVREDAPAGPGANRPSGPAYLARCSGSPGGSRPLPRRDKPAFVWKVTLLRKNEANAYCLPGGKIVVYTGILPLTRNDAGLATVLGHEVAHATAEHVAERIQRQHLTEDRRSIIAGRRRVHAGSIRPRHGVARRRRRRRRRFRSAAHRSPRPTTSARSTWRGRDTTHARRSLSGSACCERRGGRSRPSSRATTPAPAPGRAD